LFEVFGRFRTASYNGAFGQSILLNGARESVPGGA
jgi:hypothetical protein